MTPEDIAKLVAAAVENAMGAQDKPAAKAPKPAAKNATKATAAKATAIKRNLDPVEVATNDDSVTFRVVAHGASGALFAGGARVLPFVDGKVQRSFTGATVAALVESHDELIAACETVDKRAKLGAYKPAKVAS